MSKNKLVLDLFVSQNGFINWIPIDQCLILIGQAGLKHFGEEELRPLVVLGVARCELAIPVEQTSQLVQLNSHRFNVLSSPDLKIKCRLYLRIN